MTHEQREEYIRRAKKSFQTYSTAREGNKKSTYTSNMTGREHFNEKEWEKPKSCSFWKLRFLIAIILFVAIFSVYQNGSEDNKTILIKLNQMIAKDIDTESIAAWFEQ